MLHIPPKTHQSIFWNLDSGIDSTDHLISAAPASLDKRCDGESFYETAGRSHYECPLMVIPHLTGTFFMPRLRKG